MKTKTLGMVLGELVQACDGVEYLQELVADLGEVSADQEAIYLGCARDLNNTVRRLVSALESARAKRQIASARRTRAASR